MSVHTETSVGWANFYKDEQYEFWFGKNGSYIPDHPA